MTYREKLLETKNGYPFHNWRRNFNEGLTRYTEENCSAVKKVFDDLIDGLIQVGENATVESKVEIFKTAIFKTNELNDAIEGLIETGEREDLCELTDSITIACGLDPGKYGDGEGLATEWRDW